MVHADLLDLERQPGSAVGAAPHRRLRVLVLGGCWPHIREHEQAANVVAHEITRCLADEPDLEVHYACLSPTAVPCPQGAVQDKKELEARGVRFVEPALVVPSPSGFSASRLRLVLRSDPRDIIPGTNASASLAALVKRLDVDIVLSIWTEYATAACYGLPVPVIAYYGNPDHKAQEAQEIFSWRMDANRLQPGRLLRFCKSLIMLKLIERAHLTVMRSLHKVGDVAANDAAYYEERGVRASYIQNMWPSATAAGWEELRDAREQTTPLKIAGNVGALSATGNTHGLHTLATALLPELKRTLGENPFEIHLFGGRQPHPAIKPLLQDPHIRMRGFVEDIDGELMSAPIFLVANNHERFKVGHTRFLHCWSLGGCAVAFDDCREAMPEIRHNENALLGRTPGEVASLVAAAARDRELRRRIGRGGVATLAEKFRPEVVGTQLAGWIREAAGR